MENPKEVSERKIDFLRYLSVPIAEELLNQPLSDLLRDRVDVHEKDMYGWVHRTSDVRIEEARKRGKIAQSMNAFMLYRFAYYELAKKYLSQKNHRSNGQAISKAIGLGWRSETPAIRRKFIDLASIERHNRSTLHPKAHQHVTKRRQRSTGQTPSLPLASDTKMHGANFYNQSGTNTTPEMSSSHLEQPGLHLDQFNGLQRPAVPDCRIMNSSPALSGISHNPGLLGETLHECGELMERDLKDPLPVESMLELNDYPLCTGYIDPRLLL